MKVPTSSVALFAVLSMQACGSPDEPIELGKPKAVSIDAPPATTPPSAPTLSAAPAPQALHGGTVITTGEHPVEVVTHASGEVYAYVLSPTPAAGDVELRVEVPVANGPAHSVTLQWDAHGARYEGRVRGVVIVPGPLVVRVVAGPQVWVGHSTTFVIAPAIIVEVRERRHKKHKKHRRH